MEEIQEKQQLRKVVEDQHHLISACLFTLHKSLEKRMGSVPIEYRKDIVVEMLKFYINILKKKKQKLLSFDFYKVLSWYSILLATRLRTLAKNKHTKSDNWVKVLECAVQRMLENVKDECGREIPENEPKKIITMVAYEIADKGNLGIGKNGLYMLMRILTLVKCPNSST